jgi:predicted MFS family arabinose efflux permease
VLRPGDIIASLRSDRGPFSLLLLTVFFADLGLGIQIASYPNFMVEQLAIRPEQLGILETVRETPGFILVFIAALTMHIAEPVLAAGALLLEAIGMSSVFFVVSVDTLILISFTWSLGLHTWMPLNQSIALALSDDTNRGMRLGQVRSTTSLANLAGMGLVALLAAPLGLRSVFLVAGAAIFVAALLVFRIPRDLRHVEKPRLVFKRKYGLYYALTFLEGSRKQVFITFAVFALVKVYGATVREVALAMVAVSVVNLVISPIVGRAIDRWGERRILTVNYVSLVFIFIGYAVVTYLPALFGLYILDGIIFTLSLAVTTYMDRIADRPDVMPTLSMGVTANHLAAIVIPVSGGLLWASYGYQLFFVAGAVIVAVSLVVAQFVPSRSVLPVSQPA